jgi:hypothetical protein
VGSATMPAAPAAALFNPLVGPSGRA